MARPQKAGLEYFPHDTTTDEKIEAMEAKYGLAGHGFYFSLCERAYRTKDGELDISDAETIQILSRNWRISINKFNDMLATALKIGLFDNDLFQKTKRLSSDGIKKRMDFIMGKREAMRQRYELSKLKQRISAAETREETQQKPDKEKEIYKVKENIDAALSETQQKELENIRGIYENNVGQIVPLVDVQLKEIAKNYPLGWFGEAVNEMISCSTARNLKYIKAILEGWKVNGFKCRPRPAGRTANGTSTPDEMDADEIRLGLRSSK